MEDGQVGGWVGDGLTDGHSGCGRVGGWADGWETAGGHSGYGRVGGKVGDGLACRCWHVGWRTVGVRLAPASG